MANTCPYYDLFKGKMRCKKYNNIPITVRECDNCKIHYGGYYPRPLPEASLENCDIDVIDRKGNVLAVLQSKLEGGP